HGKGEPAPTRVQVSLAAKNGSTQVTLAHSGIGRGKQWAQTAAEFAREWEAGLENLQSMLETGIDLRLARLPRLGILVGDFNPEIAAQLSAPVKEGIRLEGTFEGTGAHAAGLQKDDVIVKLGGKKAVSFPTLTRALEGRQAGDKVPVVFYRGNEKKMVQMELSRRPLPDYPSTAAALAEAVRQDYDQVNAELAGLVEGLSEEESAHRPGPETWSIKEAIAHFIASERDFQSWVSGMLHDNVIGDSLEFRPNANERLRALVERYPTLPALLEELKRSEAETVALLAALPPEFVARKHLYQRVAGWMTQVVPSHFRDEHFGDMRAAIESARQAQSH
ncbi:MAG: DinB family protein, partial [Anaerolineales bacterium]